MPLEAFSAGVAIAVACSLRAFLVVVCASEQAKRGTGPAGLNARRLASHSLIMPRARAKRGFRRGPVGRCSGLSWSWQQPRALGVGCWNERVLSVRKRNPAICACLDKRVRLSRGALSLPLPPAALARPAAPLALRQNVFFYSSLRPHLSTHTPDTIPRSATQKGRAQRASRAWARSPTRGAPPARPRAKR